MWMKQNWGPHFWARAGLSDISAAYGNYFRVGSPWGTAICGLGILVMLVPLFYRRIANKPKTSSVQLHQTPLAERILIAGFIALPVLGFAVAKLTHGPFVERYFLASIFGIVVAAAFVLQRASLKTIFGAAMLLSLAVLSQEIGFWKSWVGRSTPASIIAPVASLANASPYRDLPIVVSDAGEYVELWHYAPPDLFRRVVTLPDPELAATYAGTDTVDRLVLALRVYGLSGIQDFPAFTAEHPRFLLYSNGSAFDWWPTRLSHDGYQLQLIKPSFHSAVYLVGPKPN